jgi:hypothetical protein
LQGMSTDTLKVDLGDSEKAVGSTYVALSRVRAPKVLVITSLMNLGRLLSIANSVPFKQRIAFDRLLSAREPATVRFFAARLENLADEAANAVLLLWSCTARRTQSRWLWPMQRRQ